MEEPRRNCSCTLSVEVLAFDIFTEEELDT
jgi:hypothetical protein